MKIGAVAGDATQAFVHADMDEKIVTRIPRDLDNLEIVVNNMKTTLQEGDWLEVIKALYSSCGSNTFSRPCKN